jgi:putative aminopeptidase FrvX
VVGVPVRYAHSTNCISSTFDFEATVQLVMELLRTISAEHIAAF